jgi:ribonucleoside-diphosphate reductase beta chain
MFCVDMSKTLLNIKNNNTTKEPIFFGSEMGLQRYDVIKYPKLKELAKRQRSYYWDPEEVEISKDKLDFVKMSDREKHVYIKNLQYQILLDSAQGRSLLATLGKYCSLNELETCLTTWQFFENIHSLSYTHIIENIFNDASPIYDDITSDYRICDRAVSVIKYYDNLLNIKEHATEKEKWQALYLTLISINILEGIRFYVSFVFNFAFAEEDKMLQSAKIMSFIAKDESVHLQMSQYIINLLKREESTLLLEEIIAESEPLVISMYEDACAEEIEWAKYMLRDGPILRLNLDLVCSGVRWLTNTRMKAIGIKPVVEGPLQNPISFMNKYLYSDSVQVAPQETELTSYIIRGLDKSKLNDFSSFKL